MNPGRITGLCGRLRCCLAFEHPVYRSFRDRGAAVGRTVETPLGTGVVRAYRSPRTRSSSAWPEPSTRSRRQARRGHRGGRRRVSRVAVVGSTVRDVILEPGRPPAVRAGGAPLFAARALAASGDAVSVATRCADAGLATELASLARPLCLRLGRRERVQRAPVPARWGARPCSPRPGRRLVGRRRRGLRGACPARRRRGTGRHPARGRPRGGRPARAGRRATPPGPRCPGTDASGAARPALAHRRPAGRAPAQRAGAQALRGGGHGGLRHGRRRRRGQGHGRGRGRCHPWPHRGLGGRRRRDPRDPRRPRAGGRGHRGRRLVPRPLRGRAGPGGGAGEAAEQAARGVAEILRSRGSPGR